MNETTDNPEDVERLLVEARTKLQAFEDGVDRKRLLKRLKTQSPAHPILLFRALFLFLAMLCGAAALTVLIVPMVDTDLARVLARIEAVVPAPQGIPGMPALLGVVMACMLVAWFMSTLAAYAMGRDAQMLPWEQKQHQKLVNEVTRLTTQKAVMERIRGTPVGPRARMFTPVPESLRDGRSGSPMAQGRRSALGSRSTAEGAEPRFSTPSSAQALAPARPGGALHQARSRGGRPAVDGGSPPRATPAGSPQRPLPGSLPGTPLGDASRSARLSAPIGFPGTPHPSERGRAPTPHIFGTPPPSNRAPGNAYREPEEAAPPAGAGLLRRHRAGALDGFPGPAARDLGGPRPSYVTPSAEPPPTRQVAPAAARSFPRWGPIEEPWLDDAIQKAEAMGRGLPEQAHVEFSQETHLPFTLVIARATPAMAMRAVIAYVEFLASIATPPRARIELANVPELDREFHRNVSAALEPFFGDRFIVEPEIGRVEIVFQEPDASWQDHPILPIL